MARKCFFLFCLGFVGLGLSVDLEAQLLPTFVRGNFSLGNDIGAASPYDLDDTFFLESNPGASKTIFLDFDGHHSVDNLWDHDIVFDSFDTNNDVDNFSNGELIQIQRQFQNVVEDFLPFDVNVTTRDPGQAALIRSSANDQNYGVRSLNTRNEPGSGAGGGGTAFVNVFGRVAGAGEEDTPAFTFNRGENVGGMTNTHEIGHTLGLFHDGLGNQEYHPGSGNGETAWGPLMGAPFGANISQWSNGDYVDATTFQDDLSIITNDRNGINFRDDVVGDVFAEATDLQLGNEGDIFSWGIIEQNTDIDMFSLLVGEGNLQLDILPFQGRPNLDILANLYDDTGALVATSDLFDSLSSTFDLQLDAGEYFLSIEGTGRDGLYSSYGSLGFYTIQGSGAFTAVPEPGSLAVIGLAAIGLAFRRKRAL